MKITRDRTGFTLLELMIALSILSTLLLVAWSMLNGFRDVQEKGRRRAIQLQTVRSIRQWMESDLLRTSFRPNLAPTLAGQRPNRASLPSRGRRSPTVEPIDQPSIELIGSSTSLRFTISIPADPAELLSRLFPEEVDEATQDGNRFESQNAGPLPRIFQPPMGQVEYRLIAADEFDDERWMMVRSQTIETNRMAFANEAGRQSRQRRSPFEVTIEPIRSAQDLFRSKRLPMDAEFPSDAEQVQWQDLGRPAFRYSDGKTWKSNWNSRQAGGNPKAIEFCFDLATTNPRLKTDGSKKNRDEWSKNDRTNRPDPASFFADNSNEPTAVRDIEEIPECDVRMVIRIPEIGR